MTRPLVFHDDRLFPADERTRGIARALYGQVKGLPIISPHGHTDPAWFATNEPFQDATDLLLAPDHYLYRMLYSQGISLDALKVRSKAGVPATDPREAWRLLAQNFHLFRGTPSWMWLNHVFCQGVRLHRVPERRRPRTTISTASTKPWPPRRSGPGPCSTASTSRPWPPPRARRIGWSTTRPSARAAGAATWSPPIAPTRSSTSRTSASAAPSSASPRSPARTSPPGRAIWKATACAGRPSSRPAPPPSDHGHPTAATADLSSRRGRGPVPGPAEGERHPGRRPSCSAPRC